MVMLEGCVQRIGFACISRLAHQPVRLRRKAIRADGDRARAVCREGRPGHVLGLPTLPPFAAASPPCMVRRETFRISIGIPGRRPIRFCRPWTEGRGPLLQQRAGVEEMARDWRAAAGRGLGGGLACCQNRNARVEIPMSTEPGGKLWADGAVRDAKGQVEGVPLTGRCNTTSCPPPRKCRMRTMR
jgi:hypothetical protein